MEIPRYWARSPQRVRLPDGTFEVAMWGWSDRSVEEARAHARRRAAWLGERRRDEGRWYPQYPGGALREAVLERFEAQGELQGAVTRNRYGAAVLNTRDVIFVDIDDAPAGVPEGARWLMILAALVTLAGLPVLASQPLVAAAGLVLLLLGWWRHRSVEARMAAREPLAAFYAYRDAHPQMAYRLYRTAAGHRLVLLDARHAADSPFAMELMRAVGGDRLYVRLCRNQRCYRARLTPKPWRIGVPTPHLRHPCEDADTASWQEAWVANYERRRQGHGVVELVEERGVVTDPLIRQFVALHDRWALASGGASLA